MRKFSKKQKELLLTPELRMISPDGLMIEVHWDQADVDICRAPAGALQISSVTSPRVG